MRVEVNLVLDNKELVFSIVLVNNDDVNEVELAEWSLEDEVRLVDKSCGEDLMDDEVATRLDVNGILDFNRVSDITAIMEFLLSFSLEKSECKS